MFSPSFHRTCLGVPGINGTNGDPGVDGTDGVPGVPGPKGRQVAHQSFKLAHSA